MKKIKSIFAHTAVAAAFILQSTTGNAQSTTADATIRPFKVHIPEQKLVDLKKRIAATSGPNARM